MGDLTISPFFDDEKYLFGIFSRAALRNICLRVEILNLDGKRLEYQEENISSLRSGVNHAEMNFLKCDLEKYDLREIVLAAYLEHASMPVYERLYFPNTLSELSLRPSSVKQELSQITSNKSRFAYELRLSANELTVGVNITRSNHNSPPLILSDNCLDILPTQTRSISIESDAELEISDLKIESYNSAVL
jgi:hypothetical protein